MNGRPRLETQTWYGVYTTDFSLEQVRQRSADLVVALANRGWPCLVAYDTRFLSNLIARDLWLTMQQAQVSASLAAAPLPLPAIRYALKDGLAPCALVVSARNRPYWYNGLVLLAPAGCGLRLEEAGSALAAVPFPATLDGTPDGGADLRGDYLNALRQQVDIELIRRASLTIVVDPMNGSTVGYLPGLIGEGVQTRAIEINREADPLFGRVTPLPVESGMNRLRKLVRESDSHIGLACSADGMALGVADKNGEPLELLEVALLLGTYLSRQHRQKGLLVAPLPGPGSPFENNLAGLTAWENDTGIKLELTAEPGPRIAEVMAQERPGLVVGCTAEGEITLPRYSDHPDALAAASVLMEMIARRSGSLRALIDEVRGYVGS
ncbi:MAG: phosphoglucomutase [Chloroflexaceae bacterium]|jgi:phosphomannomutase|nr:phosphoglucomutase [Chloroflexaceae bacterium]